MNILEFVEMHQSYLNEFFESDEANTLSADTSYVDWVNHFEMWVDDNKSEDQG
jgi:hypothetical protein